MLNVVDEFTRECPAIRIACKSGAADVIDVLADLLIACGTLGPIRFDRGKVRGHGRAGLYYRPRRRDGVHREGQPVVRDPTLVESVA